MYICTVNKVHVLVKIEMRTRDCSMDYHPQSHLSYLSRLAGFLRRDLGASRILFSARHLYSIKCIVSRDWGGLQMIPVIVQIHGVIFIVVIVGNGFSTSWTKIIRIWFSPGQS